MPGIVGPLLLSNVFILGIAWLERRSLGPRWLRRWLMFIIPADAVWIASSLLANR